MSSENWKLEKDLCRCCHSDGSFKNLAEPFTISDVVEIYADMLKECYDIDMAPVPGMLSAVTYTICEVCVIRLRDAADFKKQVQSCEERFKDMYNKNIIKGADALDIEVEVKQEIPDSEPDDDFKEDFPQDINDDDDFDESMDLKINDEDEKPVEEEEVTTKKKYNTRPRTTVKKPTVKSAPVKSAPVKKSPVKSKKKTKRKNLKPKSADTENDAEAKQDRVVAPNCNLKIDEDYKQVGDTYYCARCDKTYNTRTALRQHVRIKHRDPRYKCPVCIEAFSTHIQLIVHKLEVHNVDDRFKCSVCDKTFNAERQLNFHMNYFHMLGQKHHCHICDFETYNANSMRNHKLFTHKTEKDLNCRYCTKSFKRSSTLYCHERIHTGERRKVCTVCRQAFVQKASLNYHMSKHHPGVQF